MNRAADEKLRQAVREWLKASPAAGASLHVDGAVFVRVGTPAQLQEVTPREERGPALALRQVFERDLRDMWGRLTIETTELEEALRRAAAGLSLEQVPGLHLVVFDVPGEDPDHPPRPFVIDDERAAGFHREHFLPNHLEPVYRLK
jgi:hypothetical protein